MGQIFTQKFFSRDHIFFNNWRTVFILWAHKDTYLNCRRNIHSTAGYPHTMSNDVLKSTERIFWTFQKKSEVRVSKKLHQSVCQFCRCSNYVSVMFLWCFGSNWCALHMVKKFFCLRKIHLSKKLFEAFSTVFSWNWQFIWRCTWHVIF